MGNMRTTEVKALLEKMLAGGDPVEIIDLGNRDSQALKRRVMKLGYIAEGVSVYSSETGQERYKLTIRRIKDA